MNWAGNWDYGGYLQSDTTISYHLGEKCNPKLRFYTSKIKLRCGVVFLNGAHFDIQAREKVVNGKVSIESSLKSLGWLYHDINFITEEHTRDAILSFWARLHGDAYSEDYVENHVRIFEGRLGSCMVHMMFDDTVESNRLFADALTFEIRREILARQMINAEVASLSTRDNSGTHEARKISGSWKTWSVYDWQLKSEGYFEWRGSRQVAQFCNSEVFRCAKHAACHGVQIEGRKCAFISLHLLKAGGLQTPCIIKCWFVLDPAYTCEAKCGGTLSTLLL